MIQIYGYKYKFSQLLFYYCDKIPQSRQFIEGKVSMGLIIPWGQESITTRQTGIGLEQPLRTHFHTKCKYLTKDGERFFEAYISPLIHTVSKNHISHPSQTATNQEPCFLMPETLGGKPSKTPQIFRKEFDSMTIWKKKNKTQHQ